MCACPAGQGVYQGACASCPSDRITAGGICVIPPAVEAAANATLLAEAANQAGLGRGAAGAGLEGDPNITTSAGIPVLVVAATMLHADVVSVLLTAGASPLVKVDGVSDATYNRNAFPRFIPEALMERGLSPRRRTAGGGWRKHLSASETARAAGLTGMPRRWAARGPEIWLSSWPTRCSRRSI